MISHRFTLSAVSISHWHCQQRVVQGLLEHRRRTEYLDTYRFTSNQYDISVKVQEPIWPNIYCPDLNLISENVYGPIWSFFNLQTKTRSAKVHKLTVKFTLLKITNFQKQFITELWILLRASKWWGPPLRLIHGCPQTNNFYETNTEVQMPSHTHCTQSNS
jgi:hypothetical protein